MRDVLAPWLGLRGVYLTARIIGKPGHKGGAGEYPRFRQEVLLVARGNRDAVVTTMFDFYAMPDSWPGRTAARKARPDQRATAVESAILADLSTEPARSFDPRRFIPYVQLHEFEALLFSEPETVCEVMESPKARSRIRKIRNAFSTPEEIDDDPNTAPSRRLIQMFPNYRKRLHGSIAAQRIGIETMRSECPHFAGWLERLVGTAANSGETH